MKYVRLGALIGLLCPLAFVALIWLIQFVIMVLAPDREGPNWSGFLVAILQTLMFASPFLLGGAVIVAVLSVVARAFVPRARRSDEPDKQAAPLDAADSR